MIGVMWLLNLCVGTTYFFLEKDPEDEHDFAEDDDSPEEETSDSLAENSPGNSTFPFSDKSPISMI